MTIPIIYFKKSLVEKEEYSAAANYFSIVTQRTAVPPNSLVIPRYSALPDNAELEQDITTLGSTLINTHKEHVYVADLQNWYEDLIDLTPKTWFSLDQIPEEGPFVLKGATNSKKSLWTTHCFAKNKKEAIQVYLRLKDDGYIGYQDVYIRQYVPLIRICESITSGGPPVSEEYRFFVFNKKIIASGFYWNECVDDITIPVDPNFVPVAFLDEVIYRISPNIHFFVVDIARTTDNSWIVIELNDGQQSGLSAINPIDLYANLYKELTTYLGK